MKDNTMSKSYFLSRNTKSNIMSNFVLIVKYFFHLLRNCFFIILLSISFIVLIVFSDSIVNQFRSNKLPALFDMYEIVSPSMTPTIKVNDAIMIKRVDYKSLKKGDIITFKSSDSRLNGMVITHRINDIVKNENGEIVFVTKGDNNSTIDDAVVLPKNIYGKVVTKIPFFKYIKNIVTNPFIISLVFVIIILLIVNKKNNGKINKNQEIEILTFDDEYIEIL